MTEKEALTRIKTGNFNGGYGFDMQLLINTVGIIGEMFKKGQISEIVRCKDCEYSLFKEGVAPPGHIVCTKPFTERWQVVKPDNWFCADGERR